MRSASRNWRNDVPAFNNNHLVQLPPGLLPAALNPLPCDNPPGIRVHLPHPDAAVKATIPGVPAKARAASVAHPGPRRLAPRAGLGGRRRFECAVVVDVVMSTADGHDALFGERGVEARVEARRRDALAPATVVRCVAAGDDIGCVSVFRQWDVDEGHIEVDVAVLRVLLLQAPDRVAEPVDLRLLQPVVALEVLFVRRVCVRVEEIKRDSRVLAGAWSEHFDVVVAYAVDVVRAGLGEGIR